MSRVIPALAIVVMITSLGVTQAQTPSPTPTQTPRQTRPDFSGTWIMDEARSASPHHEGFVGPVTWTIRQTAAELAVDTRRGSRQQTLTYTLLDRAPSGPSGSGPPSFRGYWEGDTLITETTQNIQGQTVTTREARALAEGGREMHVERLVRVEHGYTLKGAQNYNTAKDVFTRVGR